VILQAIDFADGSGGELQLSGNTGTAQVFVSRFIGTNASRQFTLAGELTGDGTLTLADAELGPYLAVAVNGSQLAGPIAFRLSDGAAPMHYRCLEAVREYVMSLSLSSVSANPDDHVICKLPYRPDMELNIPKEVGDCKVMYFPRTESRTPADNERDTVTYTVQVLLVRKLGHRLFMGLPELLANRQRINESMSWEGLPDLPEIYAVSVEPGAIVLPEQWKLSYDCSTLVFRCMTEQPSGIL
jgi:hypothetical protein